MSENKLCLSISLDLLPVRDWFRLHVYRWSPGRYAQLLIGPIRVDFFEG